jgi:hypothetical protein
LREPVIVSKQCAASTAIKNLHRVRSHKKRELIYQSTCTEACDTKKKTLCEITKTEAEISVQKFNPASEL